MRIILDNGAYSLRNMGDVAMLQTSLKRVRAMVREAEVMILTTNPDLLPRYCPGAIPLSVESRDSLYRSDLPAQSHWAETWARMKQRWGRVQPNAFPFQQAMGQADAVFLCGGGFLNDINPYQTRPVLRMLRDAALQGKRTAMFSQGLGPLGSPELIMLLRRMCHAGTPIALRENLYGPEILARAHAEPGQFSITGDDAVEMAWEAGPAENPKALGFSVRQVAYSGIESPHLEALALALKDLSRQLSTSIVALPVSFNSHERDHEVIAQVIGSQSPRHELESPESLIAEVARCRVLVTGTYHAAVFALARGIPCVCFYVSTYYRSKMEGLAAQFPGGCQVVDLEADQPRERLVGATMRLWDKSSKELCVGLRKQAETQIELGKSFYQRSLGVRVNS